MSTHGVNRRDFIKGCGALTAASFSGAGLFLAGEAQAANAYDTIVHVFLRGGMDGLNLVVPISGNDRNHYNAARPGLSIPATGSYAARSLTLAGGAATGFGLHPSATDLYDIWADGRLAIVHCCGMLSTVSRSHFDSQLYLDTGTPGRKGTGTGWISRAWSGQPTVPAANLPLLAVNSRQPANLLGSAAALTMDRPSDFALNTGAWQWQQYRSGMPAGTRGLNETLAQLWGGATPLETAGRKADAARRLIGSRAYRALPASWPDTNFARQLWIVAQTIRFNLGLRYATVDLGGWDTHESQGTAGSGYHYFQNKIAELSQALGAFYVELSAGGELPRTTVVVQSEFGRRVRQNGSGGTDHGYGNPLLVLGGPVNGRRFYGAWRGLDPQVLSPYFGDVPVATDYRRVLSELLIRRMRNNRLGTVFPEYTGYAPLGIVAGSDMTPEYAQISAPWLLAAPA